MILTSLVSRKKLVDFLNHISISQDVYIGHPLASGKNDSAICNITPGILFSNVS